MEKEQIGIYRRREVLELIGAGDNTIRRLMERGEFPRPIQISPRSIGWKKSDVHAWIDSRPVASCAPVPRKAKAAA